VESAVHAKNIRNGNGVLMRAKDTPLFTGFVYVVLLFFTAIALYPIVQVFSISLRPQATLLSSSLAIIPDNATWDNYVELFMDRPFLTWVWNSFFVTTVVVLTGVVLASTAGYAFSRYRFPGRRAGMLGLLITQMFPATMLLLPLYIMLAKLNLINNFLGLIVMYSSTALPFCIWQMKGYYDTIPVSLEEAARIDGLGRFGAFYRIILPLAAPAMVITALFSFMAAWTEYVVAAQVLYYEDMFTLPIGLKMFQSNMSTEWGLYAAGALVVSIPAIILFLILSRWLVSGLTLGSVKG
jgi:arabinogalactan oligomer / maltooligosaccharide transport system permease protein